MALLRLQFLTRLEDPRRRWRRAWGDRYYIAAATRGLALRQNERLRLQTISAEYATCSRNPHDIIELIRAQTPAEWETLLEAFEALNHALPAERVSEVVTFVRQTILEARHPAWSPVDVGMRAPAPAVFEQQAVATGPETRPYESTSSKDRSSRAPVMPAPAKGTPITAAKQPSSPSAAQSSGGIANRRDLGPLTGMFDDE